MPSDITGTEVIYSDPATGERQFKFSRSDLRQHRAGRRNQPYTAKKQRHARSMQERKVTSAGLSISA